MPGRIETVYGSILRNALFIVNPLKKALVDTPCNTHKLINFQALEILKNDQFLDAYHLYSDFIVPLNEGVVWADQDFKSLSHFYNPIIKRGLYGSRSALGLASEYYSSALMHWKEGSMDKSVFYLGASVHIVQDMTIPQHANIRLLDDHRKYENYIKRTCLHSPDFMVYKGGYYLGSIDEFVRYNARNAIRIYSKLKYIKSDEERFISITKYTLPLAQKTTAGCLLQFYKDISKK